MQMFSKAYIHEWYQMFPIGILHFTGKPQLSQRLRLIFDQWSLVTCKNFVVSTSMYSNENERSAMPFLVLFARWNKMSDNTNAFWFYNAYPRLFRNQTNVIIRWDETIVLKLCMGEIRYWRSDNAGFRRANRFNNFLEWFHWLPTNISIMYTKCQVRGN